MMTASVFAFDYPLDGNKCKPLTKSSKVLISFICVLLVCSIIFSIGGFSTLYKNNALIRSEIDQSLLDIIKEDPPEHIFNDYHYGETLIYNDLPVFFDSRADVYSGEIIQDAVSLIALKRCGESQPDTVDSEGNSIDIAEYVINKYGFNAFLIDSGRPLYNYLASHPDKYELVTVSGITAYFKEIEK